MSDSPFGIPPTPLMTAQRARDVARSYKAMAEQFADLGVPSEANRAERQSHWWLNYAIALATTGDKPSEDKTT